jgi:integrase
MRPVPRVATEDDHELLAGYARFCADLGSSDRALRDRLRTARAFLATHPDLDAWLTRPVPTRLVDLRRIKAWPLLSYLACAGKLQLDIDLLLAKDQGGLGATVERFWRADFERARTVATRLGWRPNWIRTVVRETLPLVLAWTGKHLAALTEADLDDFRSAVQASPAAGRWTRRSYSAHLFSTRVLLHEMGIFAVPPRRGYRAATLAERFAVVPAAEIRRTMLAYVEARSATLAKSSLEGIANSLILFGEYLGTQHPDVSSLRELERRHVEGFLVWNRTRPWRGRVARPQPVSICVVQTAVLTLRNFLDDITLWGWAERPSRGLVFASDVPRLPRPLPRALTPEQDGALMAAVAQLADPFARTAITLLRQAGLRLGECLDLELDCVIDYGHSGTWLRVPLGKLATERMVPLESSTVGLLDAWAAGRGRQRPQPHPRTGRPTDFLFAERGYRIGPWRIRSGLAEAIAAAALAGPGGAPLPVTPHQLRHTYATELANAGMSLQGLMALLGHVTPEMTLRYATLASPTLRAGYDAAVGKLRRPLTAAPTEAPAVPDKAQWLAAEFLKTRVATGLCSRHLAAEACPYANICETCENFVPVPEFIPALRAQLTDIRELRADAGRRGWNTEVERHGRVIHSLEAHLHRLEKTPAEGAPLDMGTRAG